MNPYLILFCVPIIIYIIATVIIKVLIKINHPIGIRIQNIAIMLNEMANKKLEKRK